MFLTAAELADLTKRKLPRAQVRALRTMGIEHIIRPDGSPVVLRAHVEAMLGAPERPVVAAEPDWSSLNAA
jgi:hypothetical protein